MINSQEEEESKYRRQWEGSIEHQRVELTRHTHICIHTHAHTHTYTHTHRDERTSRYVTLEAL